MNRTFASFAPYTLFCPIRPERAEAPSPGHRPGLLRAPCCLPLYPGRCPGLGASALSGRAASGTSALSGRVASTLHFLSRRTMILSAISKKTILALAFCEIMRLLSSKRLEMLMMFASLIKRAKFLAKFSSSCVM